MGIDDKDSQETLWCAKKSKLCDAVGNLIFSQILRYGNASVDAFPAIYVKKKSTEQKEEMCFTHFALVATCFTHKRGLHKVHENMHYEKILHSYEDFYINKLIFYFHFPTDFLKSNSVRNSL